MHFFYPVQLGERSLLGVVFALKCSTFVRAKTNWNSTLLKIVSCFSKLEKQHNLILYLCGSAGITRLTNMHMHQNLFVIAIKDNVSVLIWDFWIDIWVTKNNLQAIFFQLTSKWIHRGTKLYSHTIWSMQVNYWTTITFILKFAWIFRFISSFSWRIWNCTWIFLVVVWLSPKVFEKYKPNSQIFLDVRKLGRMI